MKALITDKKGNFIASGVFTFTELHYWEVRGYCYYL